MEVWHLGNSRQPAGLEKIKFVVLFINCEALARSKGREHSGVVFHKVLELERSYL